MTIRPLLMSLAGPMPTRASKVARCDRCSKTRGPTGRKAYRAAGQP